LLVGLSDEELKTWAAEYSSDNHFSKVLAALRSEKDPSLSNYPQYFMNDNGLLYFNDYEGSSRLCVPEKLRLDIIKAAHDSLTETAHGG
ncbi:hypothetical protein K474DRAFT_1581376, partial [Panus rudis PR-1116 ss-1]